MIRRDETNKHFSEDQFRTRLRLVLVALVLVATGLVARAVDLQILDDGFLEGQGDAPVGLVGGERNVRAAESHALEPAQRVPRKAAPAEFRLVQLRVGVVVVEDELLAEQAIEAADEKEQIRRIACVDHIEPAAAADSQ